MQLSLEAIFISVCIVKLSTMYPDKCSWILMPSCDLREFTLIVFDMVILFNMETFEKHPNKCMGHMFGGGGGGGGG